LRGEKIFILKRKRKTQKRAAHTLSLWISDAIFQAIGEKKKKTPEDI
jgi:hypothetical protein